MSTWNRGVKRFLGSLGIGLILFLTPELARAESYDLTGLWRDDVGAQCRIRQIGNKIHWCTDDRPRVLNVLDGSIDGSTITGAWVDLPGGKLQTGSGTLKLRIESGDRLVKISDSIPYAGSVWTREGASDPPGRSSGFVIRTPKQVYSRDEAISVEFRGFPGNDQDWITVVKASAANDHYDQWFYTKGKQDGSLKFDALPPGEYEARAYFDWPKGGYTIQARYAFTVGDSRTVEDSRADLSLKTEKQVYTQNEPIVVQFRGFPGNDQDWITVVKATAASDHYDEWFYTKAKQGGTLTFNALPPGEYEARAYFDWPKGGYTVQARSAFRVGDSNASSDIGDLLRQVLAVTRK
jgi:hypothetical protein